MALILYAEDDDLAGELVQRTLAGEGHVVGVVPDGVSALKSMAIKHPQLVILDCVLPELPGIEVLRRMRQDPQLKDVPVLILTGRQSQKDESLAAFAGADGYLKKPFDPDYLAWVVDTLIDEGRRIGPMLN